MQMSAQIKRAFLIGTMCCLSYLAVYIARNVLGAVSPQMIELGAFTTESIGTLSSVFFITYAIGQLINGIIGNKVRAKYMISFGLIIAGICFVLFSVLSQKSYLAFVLYGIVGLSLSMIYGPMTKLVAENIEPTYAVRCSLGYDFASYLGSPAAGILAVLFIWNTAFASSGSILLLMGVICFIVFSVFEKKKIIQSHVVGKGETDSKGIKSLFKHRIVKFTLISVVTGVIRTTVIFWLPTYLSQYLGFSSEKSALIFAITSLIISSASFIAIFAYEITGKKIDKILVFAFSLSAIGFLSVFFLKNPILNIMFIVIAIIASNCAATMLWSVYCVSLKETGVVSGATGFLDFVSYMAAAVSSKLFANAVSHIGWGGLIFVWFSIMLFGLIISIPYKKRCEV